MGTSSVDGEARIGLKDLLGDANLQRLPLGLRLQARVRFRILFIVRCPVRLVHVDKVDPSLLNPERPAGVAPEHASRGSPFVQRKIAATNLVVEQPIFAAKLALLPVRFGHRAIVSQAVDRTRRARAIAAGRAGRRVVPRLALCALMELQRDVLESRRAPCL